MTVVNNFFTVRMIFTADSIADMTIANKHIIVNKFSFELTILDEAGLLQGIPVSMQNTV